MTNEMREMMNELKAKTFAEMIDNPRAWANVLLVFADVADRRMADHGNGMRYFEFN